MSNDGHNTRPVTAEQYKKMLIAQGAMYRLAISESKDMVHANLQLDVLAKSAMHHLMTNASGMFGTLLNLKSLRNGNAEALLPLLIGSISYLSKRRILIKPAIVGITTLAAVGAIAFFLSKKKNRAQSAGAR